MTVALSIYHINVDNVVITVASYLYTLKMEDSTTMAPACLAKLQV